MACTMKHDIMNEFTVLGSRRETYNASPVLAGEVRVAVKVVYIMLLDIHYMNVHQRGMKCWLINESRI